MSRRSPNNERYQKHTEPKGQTRKSAAAARPKRDGNVPPKSKTATKGRARPLPKAPARSTYREPDSPEYKKWRRVWWWSLGAGVAFVTASLVLQYVMHAEGVLRGVSVVFIAASYAALIVAFFVDYRKLRPLRNDMLAAAKTGKTGKGGGADKAAKAAASDTADTDAGSDSDSAAATDTAEATSK